MEDNEATVFISTTAYEHLSFAQLIHQSLPYIKNECAHSKSDLIIFTYDESFPIQMLHLQQDPHEIKSLILGRHTQCPLRLIDPSISLRHLTIILHPKSTQVQYQVIDLNSGIGFSVDDNPCLSMWANGASFLRILQYSLLFITPKQIDWTGSDQDIITQITHRNYEGNTEQRFKPSSLQLKAAQNFFTNLEDIQNRNDLIKEKMNEDSTNSINIQAPPVWLEHSTNETPAIELNISFQTRSKRILLSKKQLERGILIGRYERCGIFFISKGEYNPISRVHCLFISIHGVHYLIDTASTNGTTVMHKPIQQCALSNNSHIILGETLFLSWKEV